MPHARNQSLKGPDRRDHVQITVQRDPAPQSAAAQLPPLGPTRVEGSPVGPSLSFASMRSSSSSRTHARGPSASAALPRATSDSLARWKALIVNPVAQIQREGWRKAWWGKTRLRTGGAGGGGVVEALQGGMKGFASLWITEGDAAPAKSHLHGDSDLPPSATSKRYSAPFGLSRLSLFVVALLFILGLRELLFSSSSSTAPSRRRRLTPSDVSRRNPFSVLHALSPAPSRFATSIPGHDRLWQRNPLSSSTELDSFEMAGVSAAGEGDTTAIVLHWKRTDNVKVILAHLCQYTMFETILVWNNNPDIHLTRETFSDSRCPSTTLRIYNSPRNLLFFARYLACASHSTTPYCFFQDDDWVVQPIRAMYSQFKRDPEGPVVVSTNSEVATLYGLEWCFFNPPLNTCFSWVGTGAFTSRVHVERFLATITYLGYSRDELAHADNSFTTFLNEPPYVLEGRLAQLPDKGGHSEGEGIGRNKQFIQKGLVRLTDFLDTSFPSAGDLPTAPLNIDTSPYRSTPAPPLLHHPYAHHVRAPCLTLPFPSSSSPSSSSSFAHLPADPQCLFLTNLALLPPPDAIPYPGPSVVPSLEKWENHLGWTARGWMEGGQDGAEIWAEEEGWKRRWSYEGAVDGDVGTAFRSLDVVREGDYIGLGLLVPLDAAWVPKVVLRVILEDAVTVLKAATVEVSMDGYRWSRPRLNPGGHFPTFICSPTRYSSSRPSPPFANSRLLSPLAQRLRRAATVEEEEQSTLGRWWTERKKRGERLKECRVELSARLASVVEGSSTAQGTGTGKRWYRAAEGEAEDEEGEQGAPGEGWRFVRILVKGDGSGRERMLDVGWGVYEMWLTAAEREKKK
ncbi:hypothetical protein JCM11251_000776 [Rhodosporidiobolus azoricus]